MLPLKDTVRARSFPLVNWLIIAANIVVFLFETSLTTRQLDRLILAYGVVPARLWNGGPAEWLTIFTGMFLHGGWLHIFSNLWALYIFGDNVEDRMGSGRYLVFYLLSGVAAALAQAWIDPESRIPMIGASGAIAGVLGAYLVLFPNARVITLVPLFFLPWFVEVPALLYLGFWVFSQFFSGVLSVSTVSMGGVAYWAHIGGFVCGLLLVGLFARRPRAQTRWYPDEYYPW
ncbi:MAG: rhomboid family intramembrane serine protease [Anaerolineales bacterium]|nr:rhomboid family intramembrane serine protease [Anaerolineales bacterium]